MSATNRGAERRAADFYETPEWLTRAIVKRIVAPNGGRILEPACGGHAIVRVLEEEYNGCGVRIDCGDIRCCSETYERNFLETTPAPGYDLIITNPPFSLAMEFVQHALKFQGARVCMLLRLNFLGSQKRAKWLRENTPSIYVTPRRPSFTGRGTDSIEYAWFVWEQDADSIVRILPTEDAV